MMVMRNRNRLLPPIRLTERERAELNGAVAFRECTLSEFVRTAIRQEVEITRQEYRAQVRRGPPDAATIARELSREGGE